MTHAISLTLQTDTWKFSVATKQWTEVPHLGVQPPARTWANFWSTLDGEYAWVFSGSGPPGPHNPYGQSVTIYSGKRVLTSPGNLL